MHSVVQSLSNSRQKNTYTHVVHILTYTHTSFKSNQDVKEDIFHKNYFENQGISMSSLSHTLPTHSCSHIVIHTHSPPTQSHTHPHICTHLHNLTHTPSQHTPTHPHNIPHKLTHTTHKHTFTSYPVTHTSHIYIHT